MCIRDRCIDRMVNRNLNGGLPAFLVANPGLNNGYMIPQYTAAGLLGEIRTLSHPSTIDSVSTCANQEDPVSMGYFAAKKACQVAEKLKYMVEMCIRDRLGTASCGYLGFAGTLPATPRSAF